MGGELRCDSVEGQGSVFTCELPLPRVDVVQAYAPQPGVHVDEARLAMPGFVSAPLAAQRLQSPPEQAERPQLLARDGLNPARILLVEDNAVNALVAQAVLARLGVHVTLVDNGADAITWAADNEADLILMDCEMPGMDGIEATRHIRLRELESGRQSVPIVAVTANGADVFKERCEPAGMDDHLAKPYRPEDLAQVLYRHLAPPVNLELCVAR
jgi:CheY-like chemotaxis protein